MGEKFKNEKTRRILIIAAVVLVVAFGWYWIKMQQAKKMQQQAAMQAAMATPSVVLGEVCEANLSTEKEYIGSVEAIQTVNVVPVVSGKIDTVNFKEGSIVHAGQVLFTLEQKEYAATVALRKAQVNQAKAALAYAESYLKRIKTADTRAISAADLDKANSAFLAAKAEVASAEASLEIAEINLERTRVKSPITGRIGKALITKGNFVNAQGNPLAVVVQVDPVRVTFAMPDRDYLDRVTEFEKTSAVFKTKLRLSNGDEIEATGQRDFENNVVDPKTATISIRLRYENKDGKLVPGSMVRVLTKPIEEHLAKFIPQEAVIADLQGDFVYVVGASGKAEVRRITLGDEYGKFRIVESGLETGEKIIIQGIQAVRAGVKVNVVKDEKSHDTDAEKAKESSLDLKPAEKSEKEEPKTDNTERAQEQGQIKKVPVAMPQEKKQENR